MAGILQMKTGIKLAAGHKGQSFWLMAVPSLLTTVVVWILFLILTGTANLILPDGTNLHFICVFQIQQEKIFAETATKRSVQDDNSTVTEQNL